MSRYPLEPLLTAMRCTLSEAQQELRVGGGTMYRYHNEGMTREVAERQADRAGFHVYEVWPEMADDDLAEADRADEQRAERTKAIQRRAWRKKWAHMTEAQKEAKRQYLREYRAQARRAINASRRRYYQANREQELARQRAYDARKQAERKAS